LMKLWIQVI